jgi:hypothetical protein
MRHELELHCKLTFALVRMLVGFDEAPSLQGGKRWFRTSELTTPRL